MAKKRLEQLETLSREQNEEETCLLLATEKTEGFLNYEEEQLQR